MVFRFAGVTMIVVGCPLCAAQSNPLGAAVCVALGLGMYAIGAATGRRS